MMSEFFGLYALSGTATSFVAPLAIGIITGIFHSQARRRRGRHRIPGRRAPADAAGPRGARRGLKLLGFGLELGERFPGETEAVDRGGNAGIAADLEEDLRNLVLAEAVAKRALDVRLELMRPVQGSRSWRG